jgi:putative ABC transport system substrate-binding protein
MPVIGYLGSGSPTTSASFVAAFRLGLGDTGWAEGRNVAIEFRWAEDQYDRLPGLAADLVSRGVNAIVAVGSPLPARAANAATATIPIVFVYGGDPVDDGLVASFNQPGGNVTGVTFITAALAPKRLELLRELVPGTEPHRGSRKPDEPIGRGPVEGFAGRSAPDRAAPPARECEQGR